MSVDTAVASLCKGVMDPCSRAVVSVLYKHVKTLVADHVVCSRGQCLLNKIRTTPEIQDAEYYPLWAIQVHMARSENNSPLTRHTNVTFSTYIRTARMWSRVVSHRDGAGTRRVRVDTKNVFADTPAIFALPKGPCSILGGFEDTDLLAGRHCQFAFFTNAVHVPSVAHPVRPQDLAHLACFYNGVRSEDANRADDVQRVLAFDRADAAVELANGKVHVPKGYLAVTGRSHDTMLFEHCCMITDGNARTFYEVIEVNAPSALYLDVDVARSAARRPELFDRDRVLAEVLEAVRGGVRTAFSKEIRRRFASALDAGCNVFESCNEDKVSLHVVFPHVKFSRNHTSMREFVEHVRVNALTRESLTLMRGRNAIDGGVYTKNRCWRVPWQHKAGSCRLLLPIDGPKMTVDEHKRVFWSAFVSRHWVDGSEQQSQRPFRPVFMSTDIKPIADRLTRPKRIVATLRAIKGTESVLVAANAAVRKFFEDIASDWTAAQGAWVLRMRAYLALRPGSVLTANEWRRVHGSVFSAAAECAARINTRTCELVGGDSAALWLQPAYEAACTLLGDAYHMPFDAACSTYCMTTVSDACAAAIGGCDAQTLMLNTTPLTQLYDAVGFSS